MPTDLMDPPGSALPVGADVSIGTWLGLERLMVDEAEAEGATRVFRAEQLTVFGLDCGAVVRVEAGPDGGPPVAVLLELRPRAAFTFAQCFPGLPGAGFTADTRQSLAETAPDLTLLADHGVDRDALWVYFFTTAPDAPGRLWTDLSARLAPAARPPDGDDPSGLYLTVPFPRISAPKAGVLTAMQQLAATGGRTVDLVGRVSTVDELPCFVLTVPLLGEHRLLEKGAGLPELTIERLDARLTSVLVDLEEATHVELEGRVSIGGQSVELRVFWPYPRAEFTVLAEYTADLSAFSALRRLGLPDLAPGAVTIQLLARVASDALAVKSVTLAAQVRDCPLIPRVLFADALDLCMTVDDPAGNAILGGQFSGLATLGAGTGIQAHVDGVWPSGHCSLSLSATQLDLRGLVDRLCGDSEAGLLRPHLPTSRSNRTARIEGVGNVVSGDYQVEVEVVDHWSVLQRATHGVALSMESAQCAIRHSAGSTALSVQGTGSLGTLTVELGGTLIPGRGWSVHAEAYPADGGAKLGHLAVDGSPAWADGVTIRALHAHVDSVTTRAHIEVEAHLHVLEEDLELTLSLDRAPGPTGLQGLIASGSLCWEGMTLTLSAQAGSDQRSFSASWSGADGPTLASLSGWHALGSLDVRVTEVSFTAIQLDQTRCTYTATLGLDRIDLIGDAALEDTRMSVSSERLPEAPAATVVGTVTTTAVLSNSGPRWNLSGSRLADGTIDVSSSDSVVLGDLLTKLTGPISGLPTLTLAGPHMILNNPQRGGGFTLNGLVTGSVHVGRVAAALNARVDIVRASTADGTSATRWSVTGTLPNVDLQVVRLTQLAAVFGTEGPHGTLRGVLHVTYPPLPDLELEGAWSTEDTERTLTAKVTLKDAVHLGVVALTGQGTAGPSFTLTARRGATEVAFTAGLRFLGEDFGGGDLDVSWRDGEPILTGTLAAGRSFPVLQRPVITFQCSHASGFRVTGWEPFPKIDLLASIRRLLQAMPLANCTALPPQLAGGAVRTEYGVVPHVTEQRTGTLAFVLVGTIDYFVADAKEPTLRLTLPADVSVEVPQTFAALADTLPVALLEAGRQMALDLLEHPKDLGAFLLLTFGVELAESAAATLLCHAPTNAVFEAVAAAVEHVASAPEAQAGVGAGIAALWSFLDHRSSGAHTDSQDSHSHPRDDSAHSDTHADAPRPAPQPPLPAPALRVARAPDGLGLDVTWSEVTGADGYELRATRPGEATGTARRLPLDSRGQRGVAGPLDPPGVYLIEVRATGAVPSAWAGESFHQLAAPRPVVTLDPSVPHFLACWPPVPDAHHYRVRIADGDSDGVPEVTVIEPRYPFRFDLPDQGDWRHVRVVVVAVGPPPGDLEGPPSSVPALTGLGAMTIGTDFVVAPNPE